MTIDEMVAIGQTIDVKSMTVDEWLVTCQILLC